MNKKRTKFDCWYAVENTRIVRPPQRHLETFGNTIINYRLVSELMDGVGKVRIREGRMQALRPQIILPSNYDNLTLEGFGPEAQRYLQWLKENEDHIRILRYGYTLKQEAFSEQVVTDSVEAVVERICNDESVKADPFSAVVQGVDDPWDVCLVKLFWTVIRQSAEANIRELNDRRMFDLQDGVPVELRNEIEIAFEAAGKDRSLVKPLGRMLQEKGVFEAYQDRFFSLLNGK
jgi:hypothetical protein